jgi:DNA-3-methyladenine glycosylase II
LSEPLTITPRGPFSLAAAARFGFGPTSGRTPEFDGAMRLAFPLDGGAGYAGVVVRQDSEDGRLRCEVHGGGDLALAERQLARVLSLDHDGEAFLAVGERDSVIGVLQRRHPGQRPVLFHSPYEGAAWSVISARRQAAQAAAVRHAISLRLGERFELAGDELVAFPQPERLLADGALAELGAERSARLVGIAEAALAGDLDVETLHDLGPDQSHHALQQLRGIGPFYAGLIVLRAAGFADALLPMPEPRILAHAARFYGLDSPPTLEQFRDLAEPWRPFRTWTSVLLRLAGDRQFGR